jgi:hypothetical protein
MRKPLRLTSHRLWTDSTERDHRLQGPAIEWDDGSKDWYKHGDMHRVNGPAYERSGGYREWWVDGYKMTSR